MKLVRSCSSLSSICLSFGFLLSVILMNSSRSMPVESVYVSVLESEGNMEHHLVEEHGTSSPCWGTWNIITLLGNISSHDSGGIRTNSTATSKQTPPLPSPSPHPLPPPSPRDSRSDVRCSDPPPPLPSPSPPSPPLPSPRDSRGDVLCSDPPPPLPSP